MKAQPPDQPWDQVLCMKLPMCITPRTVSNVGSTNSELAHEKDDLSNAECLPEGRNGNCRTKGWSSMMWNNHAMCRVLLPCPLVSHRSRCSRDEKVPLQALTLNENQIEIDDFIVFPLR